MMIVNYGFHGNTRLLAVDYGDDWADDDDDDYD